MTAMLNPSTTKRNNKGNKGLPCLNPLVGLNKFGVASFVNKAKFKDVTQPMIQFTTKRLIPTWIKIIVKYN
jgi:hypothetical protein